jgi:hypothetical protein
MTRVSGQRRRHQAGKSSQDGTHNPPAAT